MLCCHNIMSLTAPAPIYCHVPLVNPSVPKVVHSYQLRLVTMGTVTGGDMRLRLWDSEVTGQIRTTLGAINFTIFTHATAAIHAIRLVPSIGEVGSRMDWHARQGDSPWPHECQGYRPNPALHTVIHRGKGNTTTITTTTQPLLSERAYATVLANTTYSNGTFELLASTGQPQQGDGAAAYASAAVSRALGQGFAALTRTHRAWWQTKCVCVRVCVHACVHALDTTAVGELLRCLFRER